MLTLESLHSTLPDVLALLGSLPVPVQAAGALMLCVSAVSVVAAAREAWAGIFGSAAAAQAA